MKIKAYQGGGIAYLPTTGGGAAAQQAAPSSGSSENKVPGFAKELISIVQENGLDNDVAKFLSQAERVLNVARDPYGEHLSMREILQVQRLASRVKTNYRDYEKARDSLKAENALDEIATDSRGYVYVLDTERNVVTTVRPDKVDENKHMVYTNGRLLEDRRNRADLTYDTNVLSDLNSAVGMGSIIKFVRERIADFGKTKINGYSEKQQGEIEAGMEHILAGDLGDFRGIITKGPDGVYKISQESTVADTHIDKALKYLIEVLPNEFKHTLIAKGELEGIEPEVILLDMLKINTSRTIDASYQKEASESAGFASAGGSTSLVQKKYLTRIGEGPVDLRMVPIVPRASQISDTGAMYVLAGTMGDLVDKNMKTVEQGSLKELKTKVEAFHAANTKDVTFGDQLLTGNQDTAIMWDGNSQLTEAWLPYTLEGGRVKPDFDKIFRFNQFIKEYKENPDMTQMELRSLMTEYQLTGQDVEWDPKLKMFKLSNTKLFLSFSAYANDHSIDLTDESKKLCEKVSKDEAKGIISYYNNAIKYGTIYPQNKYKKVDTKTNTAKAGQFYRGNVFMPIDDAFLAYHMSMNELVPKSEINRFGERAVATTIMNSGEGDSDENIGQF